MRTPSGRPAQALSSAKVRATVIARAETSAKFFKPAPDVAIMPVADMANRTASARPRRTTGRACLQASFSRYLSQPCNGRSAAQFAAKDLADIGFRQLVAEFDKARSLVIGEIG